MIDIDDIKNNLEEYGAIEKHEIQHSIRYYLPIIKQFVYVNKQAGNSPSGLIIHPRFRSRRKELLDLAGVFSAQNYNHLSSMGKFPKRLNKGKDEIPYGIPFGFDSGSTLNYFLNKLSNSSIAYIRDEIEEIEEENNELDKLTNTEKQTLIKSRLGQGIYRDKLIKLWASCSVTGCENIAVLRASHIKPWKDSDNVERLDEYNGLLLIPNLDTVFDKGLITFSKNGSIEISSFLDLDTTSKLGINKKLKIRNLRKEHKVYLDYHRKYVFQQ